MDFSIFSTKVCEKDRSNTVVGPKFGYKFLHHSMQKPSMVFDCKPVHRYCGPTNHQTSYVGKIQFGLSAARQLVWVISVLFLFVFK